MARVARRLMIHGRVQGVWYRGWTVDTARGLGLTGWVRNQMDGSVEAVVEGEAEAVSRFITKAHEGPSAAKVARVDSETVEPEGFPTFEQRPTA